MEQNQAHSNKAHVNLRESLNLTNSDEFSKRNACAKNSSNTDKDNDLSAEFERFKRNLGVEEKTRLWTKTLVSSFRIIPEIIRAIDKIIEAQASTISFGYNIYNGPQTTFDQVERVIDMSERKRSLMNIYLMIKSALKELDSTDLEILEKRFFLNYSIKGVAKEYNISIRTLYRKIDKILSKLYFICLRKNWSLKLIESQVKNEDWLIKRNEKIVFDYFKNLHKPERQMDETQEDEEIFSLSFM